MVVKIEVRERNKATYELDVNEAKIRDLMVKIGLVINEYIVVKNGQVVTEDEVVKDGDQLIIYPVKSGG